ncbi:MAG: hypothetical protein E3J78_06385 [Candidatus Cloacimonadota bacterium]|nr:MAG: hypothetical protein E3J78_06385 [Candidatus Cloacimonadota bacterium]
MKKLFFSGLCMILCSTIFSTETGTAGVLESMELEMERSYETLSKTKPISAYFLHYEIWDERNVSITASWGALYRNLDKKHRYLDVDVRVGSKKLDNTHEIRGGVNYMDWIPSINEINGDDDPAALRVALWAETDRQFKKAQEKYIRIQAERQVKVTESDTSPDFSPSTPVMHVDEAKEIRLDFGLWREKVKEFSSIFKDYPWIYSSQISLRAQQLTKYQVNTEGSKIRENRVFYRIGVYASTMADDGMELYLSYSFFSFAPEGLPSDEEVIAQIDTIITHLDALRKAPIVEPYIGPAILVNKASGVFFHEIFGHRVEGHRQKSEFEGQTFTKKVGEKILPDFISIRDDPTIAEFNGKDINGYYKFDDEGVPAQKVTIVESGVLKGFLKSRLPIEGFPESNGHGRRQYGRKVVSRQGVLFVTSSNEVSMNQLREALITECKKQKKPFGLIFYDISGGFTSTGRGGTQTFKVIPLFVKRIYVDGRPDEVVRGVDIVGTPLLSFAKISLTGNDYEIFNGSCGAESGMIPVSAISPSIFVSEIEVEKKSKSQDKPPILPSPLGEVK